MSRLWLSGISYFAVGVASLGLAVFVTTTVVKRSESSVRSGESQVRYTLAQAPTATTAGDMAAAGEVSDISQSGNFLEPYIFDTREGRRNPFRPPVLVEAAGETITPGTPLERYEVDEIRLAGIMWDIRTPKAMFIDPTGAVHIIGKDDRIGRRQGYIATIRESEVVVVETTNFNGELAYATRILRIDKK